MPAWWPSHRRNASGVWQDKAPIRAELFGTERLEHHAQSLAAAQPVASGRSLPVQPLSDRVRDNGEALVEAYRICADALEAGQPIAPAAEWLLDNFHLVEEQLRQIDEDLPPGYYRQLPKLADGPFTGYPRVFGIAWAYVAHTDSLLSGPVLSRFIHAYQQVQPLMIGEIWAVAITLRIVLIENMRRLAAQIIEGHELRMRADLLVEEVLSAEAHSDHAQMMAMHQAVAPFENQPLPDVMAGQIAKRLRGYDPATMPLLGWLEDRLQQQGHSVDDVVENVQLRLGASNVTMRNIVTSMRLVSEMDWADFFEEVSLIDARLRQATSFADLDFPTRNRYRTEIEILSRGSRKSEDFVTDACLGLVEGVTASPGNDPGHWLIGEGRPRLEQMLGFRPGAGLGLRRALSRLGLAGYLGAVAVASLSFLALALWWASAAGAGTTSLVVLGLAGLAVAVEAGVAFVNAIATRSVAPQPLPGIDLSRGVPADLTTLVVVPVIFRNAAEVPDQVERLEVHYLSSIGGAVHYALLSDAADADVETTPQDRALVDAALQAVAELNARHPTDDGSDRFLFLHRRRIWNPSEGVWMGWERKRGKLSELNRLLRGARDTSFEVVSGALPPHVKYVITLDADTRLLRNTVRLMIGKMAHPLNRPRLDEGGHRVTAGYGILQPRVSPALPGNRNGSIYQRIFSSPGGIEPYAAAASDIYQDLFEEGSYTGKGIYHVDAFEAALAGRVPENALLSHDLFEGIFARSAFASDIEVIEDFPARYDVDMGRHHRWVRGDWQLLPWIFGHRGREGGGIPAIGRWKMIDNLRRSLVAPLALVALLAGWLMAPAVAIAWTLSVVLLLALPRLLPLPFGILPDYRGTTLRSHLATLGREVAAALSQIALLLVFLADQAARMLDAIGRTIWRLFGSRRDLLEWVTAEHAGRGALPTLAGSWRRMAPGVVLGLGSCAIAALVRPQLAPLLAPFALAWFLAPAIARNISQIRPARHAPALLPEDVRRLRLVARRTWHYFETFVTEEDNFLPPDNFQETPQPVIARRTSPTNIGLYLMSTVVACDMGWIGRRAAAQRLRDTLDTMLRMPRYHGHLYNWYDTRDLHVLEPAYVSSVDSGNLAGHLIAVAQACRDWRHNGPLEERARQAAGDALSLASAAATAAAASGVSVAGIAPAIDRLITKIRDTPLEGLIEELSGLHAQARAIEDTAPTLSAWTAAARQCLADHLDDLAAPLGPGLLGELEETARNFATDMDFGFLLDPEKKLLSIGFSVATNRPDANCYDLLASEARLASLFSIAKGDVPTRHWFRLGRGATPMGSGAVLISWSGSMFEYLMPSIVLRAPEGSILNQTNRLVVARQIAYGDALGIPWGVSESAYNARDLEMTYQYSNFGVPGLGLKRGLSENRVIAPYASGLAAMIDPAAAARNYARMAELGAEGRYGFYEAMDYTASRVPANADHAIVRSFMAHHQGMTITAIANVLLDGRLRDLFHAEPMVRAVELLLQERIPRDVVAAPPRATEVSATAVEDSETLGLRTFEDPAAAVPTAHLLSNGNYGVMLTPMGEGFSQWRDLAVTRWRPEPTQAALGSFIFLRDCRTGAAWTAGIQPAPAAAPAAAPEPQERTSAGGSARRRAVFCEYHAAFADQMPRFSTMTEIVVSAEDDAEARRVTLTNTGRTPREIEVTSYSELVLAPAASDLAHPAFSKMFVVTDFHPELGAIVATRRRRSPDDPEIWAAHIAVVEGEETAPIQIETDRARFVGRGRSLRDAAMAQAPLSGTTGTVLDPIFAIRRRVLVPAGGVTRVTFWTMVASDPVVLLDLVDRHRDPSAYARAATLAWTRAQVQLRHLGISHAEAAHFQSLGGMVIRGDGRLRSSPARILAGAAPQSALWPCGISGDLPIVLLVIDDIQDMAALHQVLSAHEYWGMRQLAVDLVILNDRSSSYVQDLQFAIDSAVRAAGMRARPEGIHAPIHGSVHVLRADLIALDARAMLLSVARVVLVASRGNIAAEMETLSLTRKPRPVPVTAAQRPPAPTGRAVDRRRDPQTGSVQGALAAGGAEIAPDPDDLEFFNGTGGFADGGREYVTVLRNGQTTPAPWINVIANPTFGFQVSAEGSGFVWSENSRENQITPWSNDPVADPPGEVIYLRDLDSGAVWTATALPIRGQGTYVARHGFGYSRFDHAAHDISAEMVQFVPLDAPVKVTRLRLRNTGPSDRRLSVSAYAEWVLGPSRGASLPYIVTRRDHTGAILATNTYAMAFPGRVAFADLGQETTSHTADRAEFIGVGGSLSDPRGLRAPAFSGRTGPGLDSCAALQRLVTLGPGDTVDVVFLLGQAESDSAASALVKQMRALDPDQMLAEVKEHWSRVLGAVQITSPDRSFDILLNGWLMYQTLACRIWARAGFYQASGAYGFRDQLQDGMALAFAHPELTREHLLRAASRQFPEGDVQHWWLPHSGQGVRTRISDDRVWLGYCVAQYVAVTGDEGILDEDLPFLHAPALAPGAHDDFSLPSITEETASLFDHCALALDQAVELTGTNGMPLIGTGDWNDGMNRVGEGGKGTSLWLGWLLIATIDRMALLADARDPVRAARWRNHAASVRKAIEAQGWDGEWYRRGTFDDGTFLGTAADTECRIDSIAQSWSVLSGAGDPARARMAMESMVKHLVRSDPGLSLLFTAPFDRSPLDPGYIKGYPPGLRENGGQYTHAAMWAVLALAGLRDGDGAMGLFSLLNPVNHTRTAEAIQRYKVEPYVIAADVYSTAPHEGRGGWTWYTGSAAWMYRAGVEGLLGLTRAGQELHLDPCIPKDWPQVSATVRLQDAQIAVTILNPDGAGHGVVLAQMDGAGLRVTSRGAVIPLIKGDHAVTVVLGVTAESADTTGIGGAGTAGKAAPQKEAAGRQ